METITLERDQAVAEVNDAGIRVEQARARIAAAKATCLRNKWASEVSKAAEREKAAEERLEKERKEMAEASKKALEEEKARLATESEKFIEEELTRRSQVQQEQFEKKLEQEKKEAERLAQEAITKADGEAKDFISKEQLRI